MNLTHPFALVWAALALPIIGFYLLRVRLRRVPVATDLFWAQIFEDKRYRSIWRRLRHMASLLVQLAFLALIVTALADPFFLWEERQARRVIMVLDTSASMNATDGEPTRLASAKQAGSRLLADLRPRDEAAIIVAGVQPQVVCGLTGHRRILQDALDAAPASDVPTHVTEAVTLARRLVAGHSHGQIVLLTDGCFEGVERLLSSPDVRIAAVGKHTGNVAITRFQARRSLRDPIGYEIFVEVASYFDEPITCRLDIELDGQPVDVFPLELKPGAPWRQFLEKTSADGGVLIARIDKSDALAADNTAWALLPKRELIPVTLVTEAVARGLGELFVEKVLEASPLVQQPLTVATAPPQDRSPLGVTVFYRHVPSRLPPGPILVIDPASSTDLWKAGERLSEVTAVNEQDKESPLLAYVRLENVVLPGLRKLTPVGAPRIIAAALTGHPIICAFERPEGKVLVFAMDLDHGDLPLRTAFPILAGNALIWLSNQGDQWREAVAAGAEAEVTLPQAAMSGNSDWGLWSPDGRRLALPLTPGRARVGPLDRCGLWRVAAEPAGQTAVEIACNLANREESDLRPPAALAEAPLPDAPRGLGVPVWFVLAAAALLLTAVEWFLYQRRWIT